MQKLECYREIRQRLAALLSSETDEIAIMATVACELFHHLDAVDWAGFYRHQAPQVLKIGPYQGRHGCLTIPFDRGICGRCARENTTQRIPDVTREPDHIACSSSTRSEIVVPIRTREGQVRAVLDLDSDQADAFDDVDVEQLEALSADLTLALG